ncbi:hypothetical protein F7725_025691 [Dissostichus mawsoni]|uniref:Sleeping Beauty transposase HTH domain-containing protein n=1 Tax=Dissostichus mawsoni TaxID=36200 RepID=A0A7J5X502_DISMA|nr:hypothetical protein F7725_025691 [Dissostichus mawsoni]
MDLKKRIIDFNKSGKSLGAISKQLKVPRSTVHTMCSCHTAMIRKKRELSPATERKLVRMVKSQRRTTKKQVCNELGAAGTQACFTSLWAERKPWLQKGHIEAPLKGHIEAPLKGHIEAPLKGHIEAPLKGHMRLH